MADAADDRADLVRGQVLALVDHHELVVDRPAADEGQRGGGVAGLGRGLYDGASFQEMMLQIRPFMLLFAVSGVTLMLGIWIVLWHAFRLMGEVLSPARPEFSPAGAGTQ